MEWREKWVFIRPFLAILALHLLAVSLFTRGFLLTRTELPFYSRCSDISDSPCRSSSDHSFHPSPSPSSSNGTVGGKGSCWTRPAVGRVVIIVLDALRFDFVAPSTFFDAQKPWMDKLTVLQKLAAEPTSTARIFKAIADPPTTSLQRLKGLTTGGLPTFIDVGNSFGAPAIVEDNLMYQLSRNGKRVLMIGDDTWLQLFPDHFNKTHPYPSFNVKDLDTVDDGCVKHLFPSLYSEEWDVVIAHFLGVDHAGHIFGVDSAPMIQKLEQYNTILESVVNILKNNSGPGGLHENTFLIVMGDHGQTVHGDHGGGAPEEVETSLFAMGMKSLPISVSSILGSQSCRSNVDGDRICISSVHQLDFAVTLAALLGVPFPFGSIGRVNPELYALSPGSWDHVIDSDQISGSSLLSWMHNYVDTLCINSWQVKRYIDLYSATSFIGFSSEDLQLLVGLYTKAQENWPDSINTKLKYEDGSNEAITFLQKHVDAYSEFLEKVAELARSKWTEFDLKMMITGLVLLIFSLMYHFSSVVRVYKYCGSIYPASIFHWNSSRVTIPILLVLIRASSFLSNSYILAEGKVVNFLLATTAMINIRSMIVSGVIVKQDVAFLFVTMLFRFRPDTVFSKQTVGSISMSTFSSVDGMSFPSWMDAVNELLPIALLASWSFLLLWFTSRMNSWRNYKLFFTGGFISYFLMIIHWVSESSLINIPAIQNLGKTIAPRAVYSVGLGLLLLAVSKKPNAKDSINSTGIVDSSFTFICAWSPTVMILLGRQSPFIACVSLFGAWCIIKSGKVHQKNKISGTSEVSLVEPFSVIQWSFLAACLFFYSGHWCAFDGLRYGAAFIGFDNFNIIRQGALLAIDTFGASHILPIFGLPLLSVFSREYSGTKQASPIFFLKLSQAFLIYGLVTAVCTTFMMICVTIQRRHLMVWGLFAPKYVFDVVGLILTDISILSACLYYF